MVFAAVFAMYFLLKGSVEAFERPLLESSDYLLLGFTAATLGGIFKAWAGQNK